MTEAFLSPRGPKGLPILGSLPEFLFRRIPFHERMLAEYGDEKLIHCRLAKSHVYLLNDPDLIKETLVTKAASFHKFPSPLINVMGKHGMVYAEGDEHRRQRSMILPLFTQGKIGCYASTFQRYASEMTAKWRDGDSINLHHAADECSFRIIAQLLLGTEIERADAFNQALHRAQVHVGFMMAPGYKYWDWLPLPILNRYHAAMKLIDEVVYEVIHEKKAKAGEAGDDMLAYIFSKEFADANAGETITDLQLRDQIVTLFLAGQETVATSLIWTCWLLAAHPDIQERLYAEIEAAPSLEPKDLKELSLLGHVYSESMRLFPPIWGIARLALEDVTLGNYRVPKGSTVVLAQYMVQRNPRFFENPTAFDPDRWSEARRGLIPRNVYLPFGLGARRCIGEQFGWIEGLAALTQIFKHWKLELADTSHPGYMASIALRPAKTIRVRVMRR
jgi:cytochrome P450